MNQLAGLVNMNTFESEHFVEVQCQSNELPWLQLPKLSTRSMEIT